MSGKKNWTAKEIEELGNTLDALKNDILAAALEGRTVEFSATAGTAITTERHDEYEHRIFDGYKSYHFTLGRYPDLDRRIEENRAARRAAKE